MKGNIKALRIKNNMTQKELSKKVGVTQQQISLYENGEALPSMKVAFRIAKALDSTLDDIFFTSSNK